MNKPILVVKGSETIPGKNIITKNMLVFTSNSEDEDSYIYNEKHHGYFTYFLLKKLQESRGNTNFKDLKNYVVKSVVQETRLIEKMQTPQIITNPDINLAWEKWKLK